MKANSAAGKRTCLTAAEALARLEQGNNDFLNNTPRPSPRGHGRRLEIALAQDPFAVLVGCSDSRVSPEVLFGVGLGELFIVRNAGHTVDAVAMGSIEYGVLMLGVPLIVVLGHQRCGAVQAAVEVVQDNAVFPGNIGEMVEPIIPSVLRARATAEAEGRPLLDVAVRENIRRVATRLRASASLRQPLRSGGLRIVGAEYSLDEGRVDFFEE